LAHRPAAGLSLFAVAVSRGPAPIDVDRLRAGAAMVDVVGASQRVAFLWTMDGTPKDGELCGSTSFEGRYWLIGRLRLDRRAELAAHLGVAAQETSDGALCLGAYARWGEAFLDWLAGDFCFALWDEPAGRLICVRDQLGVRTLFHATSGSLTLASDSLAWLAAQPGLGVMLDDLWIADFLTVGHSRDFERTVYARIRRLPPAHALIISAAGAAARRYWQLVLDQPAEWSDAEACGARFRELLSAAIADRLPRGRVGIAMSGGLDSPTLAATAVEVAGDPARVLAECHYYERLFVDQEKTFSALVARRLGIELRLTALDDGQYDPEWRGRGITTPEPSASIVSAHWDRGACQSMAAAARVWFDGEGPDNALAFEPEAYLGWLMKRRQWRPLARALWQHVLSKRAAEWPASLGRLVGRDEAPPQPLIPPWLHPRLAKQIEARDRRHDRGGGHPWHPRAVASFNDPVWPAIFTATDLEEAAAPLLWRYPYLDLRVLNFLLSLPPVPWARRKAIMRHAMRGRLPDEVLVRIKSPFPGQPRFEAMRGTLLPELVCGPRLAEWLEVQRLPAVPRDGSELACLIAVHALDYWLERGQNSGIAQVAAAAGQG